ncbi:hypothetical protein BS78_03G241300 [Paspalum vaginatum]|nr:hypothetical protein BS78_03G241300 [Paspalum vaginatum]
MALLHLAILIILAPTSAHASASNATTAADLTALLAFKARLSDPGGVLRANWTPGTPYCGWVGVTCGHRHRLRVTALALPGVPLAGALAPELGNLSFLSVLNLTGAGLTGPVPPSLGRLPRLLVLDLSCNYLSGAVPASLGNLTALEVLDLDSNNLTGGIPHELRGLQSVEFLILSRNELSGPVPHGLFNGTSSQLIFLSLAYNGLTGTIPGAIGLLPNLQVLELSRNQLSGQIPSSLFNVSGLVGLYLSQNNLSGPVLQDNRSFSLPMLQQVYLSKNELTGTVPPGFAACKHLQQFNLGYNRLTGGIPLWLASMAELKVISLGGNDISGEIPAGLGNLTGLTVLDFAGSRLHGKIPPELGWLTHLQWLNLERNNLTGTIPTSIKNMSMVSILDVSFNSLTGPVPRKMFGESLNELYIEENKLSGDVGFLADLTGCQSLKYIVMNTNHFTGSIPNSISNLSSLEIFRAFDNQIAGKIPDMVATQSRLSFIDLRNNRLSGEIPTSVTEMKNLRALDLSSNDLSGIIPVHIGKLANLFGLSLAYNKLHGPIPDSISNLSHLQTLELSNNRFTSTIPLGLWGLENIVSIDLSVNALSGSFSEDIEILKAISYMDLSSNQLHGSIPTSLGVLNTLTYLNLSKNMLQDQVPDAIGKLSSIKTLDLSYNTLSGTIPKSLANLSYLTTLNLSFNRLYGQIPESGVFSNITLESLEGNVALCGLPRLGFPQCPIDDELNHSHRFGLLKLVVPCIIGSIVIGACLFILIRTRVNKRPKKPPVVASLEANNHMTISYFELARATNNFDSDNLLGEGSFGKVYKGTLDDEQTVAVKVLNIELESATMSFDVECRALRMARHRNLVRILTTCSNLDFKALVLQYMPNGSLDEWLFSGNRRGLGLLQRVSIMCDVALAMAYLHHEHFEAVLHCDLKPSNVLLDEDMTACVADFGIARLLLGEDTSIVSRNMHGTIGYMAPEYASTGKASRKSDVFSYGIMLLEVITGKKPTDAMFNQELSLREWVSQGFPSRLAHVVDRSLVLDEEATGSEYIVQSADWSSRQESPSGWSCLVQIVDLGLQCSWDSPEERVAMKDVAAKLARIKECLSSSI